MEVTQLPMASNNQRRVTRREYALVKRGIYVRFFTACRSMTLSLPVEGEEEYIKPEGHINVSMNAQ